LPNSVQVIHRRDALRAGQLLQDRARQNEKITFIWDTVIDEIAGGILLRASCCAMLRPARRSH